MEKERKGSSKKVMVAIDESDFSYNALIWVLDNLKESIKDTSLVSFATQPLTNFSYPLPASLGFARFYFPTGDLIKQNQQRTRKVSLGLLEKARSICASRRVNAKTFTEAGDPKEAICNAVQVHNVNLLLVGDTDKSSGIIKRVLDYETLATQLSQPSIPVNPCRYHLVPEMLVRLFITLFT